MTSHNATPTSDSPAPCLHWRRHSVPADLPQQMIVHDMVFSQDSSSVGTKPILNSYNDLHSVLIKAPSSPAFPPDSNTLTEPDSVNSNLAFPLSHTAKAQERQCGEVGFSLPRADNEAGFVSDT